MAVAGFHDASQWEKLKRKSDAAIRRAIETALIGTSVTVVCVGERTARRPWVKYELKASRAKGNGLLGVYLPGTRGYEKPVELGTAPLYQWDRKQFPLWLEAAVIRATRER